MKLNYGKGTTIIATFSPMRLTHLRLPISKGTLASTYNELFRLHDDAQCRLPTRKISSTGVLTNPHSVQESNRKVLGGFRFQVAMNKRAER